MASGTPDHSARVPDQCYGIGSRHQIQRVEELPGTTGQVVTVEQIRSRPFHRRHPGICSQTIDRHDAGRRSETAWWPDEPSGEADHLEHAGLSQRDDLHIVPFFKGTAVQLEG